MQGVVDVVVDVDEVSRTDVVFIAVVELLLPLLWE